MKPTRDGLALLTAVALAAAALPGLTPPQPAAADESRPRPAADAAALAGTAIGAVIEANDGKVPATGDELHRALRRLGKFAQLPVPFSAVALRSGLANPRVVITPQVEGVSSAAANRPNLDGRLFFAVNMARSAQGPHVRSVEFISWNGRLKRFDFGVIENLGGEGEPELRVVDGGKCFSCHKNRGPILSAAPWTNTAHDDFVRAAMTARLGLAVTPVPGGSRAAPPLVPLTGEPRDLVDGMALAHPQAAEVDFGVRLGGGIRRNREVFRLLNRTDDGRKAFVALLVAVAEPGSLERGNSKWKAAVDAVMDRSFIRFSTDWVALQRASNSGVLHNFNPVEPTPPGDTRSQAATAGRGWRWHLSSSPAVAEKTIAKRVAMTHEYDSARQAGRAPLPSYAQPSNPKAFARLPVNTPTRASGLVSPAMLAAAVGLGEGDRRFLADALADAARRVKQPKVTTAALAREVFEGPAFADVLEGGPLPDRDEFKDRFVGGLDEVLKSGHGLADGFAPDRREYARDPRRWPGSADDEREVEAVPTTACLRCHDVRASDKSPLVETVPALAFDPFDAVGRAAWVRTADPRRRQEVLERMLKRVAEDRDMPPEDAPEYDRFRVKEAAAFDGVKAFLEAELKKKGY